MWRYRDYFVRSLNEDQPYDRFIREQLAGDELVGESEPAGLRGAVSGRRLRRPAELADTPRDTLELCGVKGRQSIGATDAIGLRAEQDEKSVKDFHATILHAVGWANDDLFFEHNGRPEWLTGVAGTAKVIRDAFA
jgi:Protein of unknown function (DUF1549)/Protein of unknown function (DUF1501)